MFVYKLVMPYAIHDDLESCHDLSCTRPNTKSFESKDLIWVSCKLDYTDYFGVRHRLFISQHIGVGYGVESSVGHENIGIARGGELKVDCRRRG